METRPADLAGAWYPGNEADCREAIEEMVRVCPACPKNINKAMGGVVPHAGWFYSGQIACNVIKCLAEQTHPDTCIIMGRHLRPGSPNYIMTEGQWKTPLGNLEIDTALASPLTDDFSFTIETGSRYEPDNTIELQLPFIKYFFPEAQILPLGLPPAQESLEIGKRAAELATTLGRKILVLGSTDLTHYGNNYGYSPKGSGEAAVNWVKDENDRRVVDLMVKMDEKGVIREALENLNACCSGAAAAAISAAKKLGASRGEKITYATSYDIRPDTSFVGYAGIVFTN